jgi:hypothetical protein
LQEELMKSRIEPKEIVEESIPNRDIRWITFIIFSTVLLVFLGLVAKLVVMKKALST